MKKLKYIAMPLFASVLLSSCASSEEHTSAGTSVGATAETTQAQTVILSMTEEKQDTELGETSEITTEAPKSEEKPKTTSGESSTTAEVTSSAPKSEKTTDKASGTTAPPETTKKTTLKTTDDGVVVVDEEDVQEEQGEQLEQEETEQPPKSEEPGISEATKKDELPPITLESAPAVTSVPSASRPETPAVSWSSSSAATAPATEKTEDKPIELPFVPAF